MAAAPWDAFLSAAPADCSWAETLRRGLGSRGFAVCLPPGQRVPDEDWRQSLREALRGAAAIFVLVGAEQEPTAAQRWERQAVSEAVWRDPAKLLLPILLGGAGLPACLRSVFSADQPIPVYRLKRPRTDLPRAIANLAAVLWGQAQIADVGELLDTRKEDRILRRERLSYIRRVAESLPG